MLYHTDNCLNSLPFFPQRTEWQVFIDKNKNQKYISFSAFLQPTHYYFVYILCLLRYHSLAHCHTVLPEGKSLLSHMLNWGIMMEKSNFKCSMRKKNILCFQHYSVIEHTENIRIRRISSSEKIRQIFYSAETFLVTGTSLPA